MVAPFPWTSLPRVDRRAPRWIAAAQAWLTRAGVGSVLVTGRPSDSTLLDLGITGADVIGIGTRDRLDDPTAYGVRIRKGTTIAHVVAPARFVRAIAQRLLSGPDELDAPRPLTRVERAILPVVVAAILDVLDARDVEVEPESLPGARLPSDDATILEVSVRGPALGTIAVVLPFELQAAARAPLAEIAAGGRGWLQTTDVYLPVVLAWARLDPAAFKELKVKDVIVSTLVGKTDVCLLAARGRFQAALARATGRVTVLSNYRRGNMDESLGDDATVDVAVALGDVRLSVRSLLELRPGQVLELGRPVGSAVELRIGARLVGRGELVDVEGDVGVRVLSLVEGTSDSTSP